MGSVIPIIGKNPFIGRFIGLISKSYPEICHCKQNSSNLWEILAPINYPEQGTTDLPIKPINRPINGFLPIIGITDPINTYIGSESDRQIKGAIIGSSTDNYMSFFPI